MRIRQAAFALREVRRRWGDAAILYRRPLDRKYQERLTRIAPISPLAFAAEASLLRAAVRATTGVGTKLNAGPFHPLDPDWGARVACHALVAVGLRNAERLHRGASNLQHADSSEAAWWDGLMGTRARRSAKRAVRALRILAEAVT